MTTAEPTTCTGCGKRYVAPIMVVAFGKIRLCPECKEQSRQDADLAVLELRLAARRDDVAHLERSIAAHKAAHPPLVVLWQGEYRKEWP